MGKTEKRKQQTWIITGNAEKWFGEHTSPLVNRVVYSSFASRGKNGEASVKSMGQSACSISDKEAGSSKE